MSIVYCPECASHVYVFDRRQETCPNCSRPLAETEAAITRRLNRRARPTCATLEGAGSGVDRALVSEGRLSEQTSGNYVDDARCSETIAPLRDAPKGLSDRVTLGVLVELRGNLPKTVAEAGP